MKKYRVYASLSASVFIGEYTAESKDAAVDMANNDREANWMPGLCHQCSNEIEVGEPYDPYAEEA